MTIRDESQRTILNGHPVIAPPLANVVAPLPGGRRVVAGLRFSRLMTFGIGSPPAPILHGGSPIDSTPCLPSEVHPSTKDLDSKVCAAACCIQYSKALMYDLGR